MSDADWKTLVRRYANGREICNCGDAYYKRGGSAVDADGRRVTYDDRPRCEWGCQVNQLTIRGEIAARVLAELPENR